MSLVNLKINSHKEKVHLYREQIRQFLFEGVEQADGSLAFFLKNQLPEGTIGDGRTWRIKVGNTPLDTENLKMMGGGAVVGTVPKGLPAIAMPKIDFSVLGYLFPYAIIISLLGFMEAISIAKAMAAKTGQRLDPNQELIGQGLANMVGRHGTELSGFRILFPARP